MSSTMQLTIDVMAVDAASSVMQKIGSSIGGIAGPAAMAATALVGIGAAATQAAGDFQAGLTSLVTGAGEAQKNIAMVGAGILQMSTDTATSTKQLTDGMYMIESAGYHGGDGLNVLKVAAQGAKVGNADLGVTANALTTIMTDYHMKAGDAAQAMNGLTATVANGKTNLQDLASSMGTVLPLASSLGLSFPQVAGALATMTNAGMSAQHAAQNLANTIRSLAAPNAAAQKSMASVGLTAQQLKNTLSTEGLTGAISLVSDAVGKKFPAGSVQAVQAFKAIMGGATGYNTSLMVGGKNMAAYQANVANITGAIKGGAGAVTGWSQVQDTFNFKAQQAQQALNALMITIGQQLLPKIGDLLSKVTPVITAFTKWVSSGHAVSDVMNTIKQNIGFVIPVVALLGAGLTIFLATVIPPLIAGFIAWAGAAWGAATATIAATWPILAIVAAIALLVAGFILLYNNSKPVRDMVALIGQAFQQLWQVVVSQVWPALQQLWQTLVSQLQPAWQQMQPALQAIGTVLKVVGVIIVGVVLAAIFLFIAGIRALLGMLTGLFTGISMIFTGIGNIISGAMQFTHGIMVFFLDLITGRWDKLGGDLGNIWGGIVKMFQGVWQVIVGVFVSSINAIIGMFNGFVGGIIGGLNLILTAMHQAPISIGQIPMISGNIAGAGNIPASAAYKSIGGSKGGSAAPKAPTGAQNPNVMAILAQLQQNNASVTQLGAAQQAQSAANTSALLGGMPSASLPAAGAVTAASGKAGQSAATILKQQQAAQAQQARLSAEQTKALAASNSPAVQALVARSKAAEASGNTAMANLYGQQALQLANQQKAAATKATKAATAASHHQQVLAAAAAKKAASAAKHQQTLAAAAAHHKAVLAAQAARQAQAASHHKALVDVIQASTNQITTNQCANAAGVITTAAGVALPNYAAQSGYSASNAQASSVTGGGDMHIHVHLGSDNDDDDRRARKVADAVKKELGRQLRGQGNAPRYVTGTGAHL